MTTIVFESEFERGEVVYITTDKEQLPRFISGILYIGDDTECCYELRQGERAMSNWFSKAELSRTKDIILTSTN